MPLTHRIEVPESAIAPHELDRSGPDATICLHHHLRILDEAHQGPVGLRRRDQELPDAGTDQADGYVQIYSEPGLGTAVTILLPATSQIETAPAPPKEQAPPPHGAGRTVLLVEDEAALREVTQRILVRNGYEVITAANGRDAVQVAAKHPGSIELLVTDVVMPQMAGREAAEQISALYPAAKVLFMSGYTAGALDTGGVLEAGVNLIEKPFNGASLLAKLHEIMSETG